MPTHVPVLIEYRNAKYKSIPFYRAYLIELATIRFWGRPQNAPSMGIQTTQRSKWYSKQAHQKIIYAPKQIDTDWFQITPAHQMIKKRRPRTSFFVPEVWQIQGLAPIEGCWYLTEERQPAFPIPAVSRRNRTSGISPCPAPMGRIALFKNRRLTDPTNLS
ncbi:hypothetical protein HNO86_24490 [Pseudomonas sp. C1C7]|uniref:hypothetical protein n=1 Tax=Pseudomonas sp. C1C7 TaxID=2735272 RepID=UPI00158689FF|nr:hypothetical protein [Pseudomonas sp. C1C7]NUT78201.1 hypothetical protein [Pseudomonas sp. C1C7]